jgi:hypothetical protein
MAKRGIKFDSPTRLASKSTKTHEPDAFACAVCQTPNSPWSITVSVGDELRRRETYCSVCMPEDVINSFLGPRGPGERIGFRRLLKAAGNRYLNGGE